MNIYLEDIADEFSYHERSSTSSEGQLRSRHHKSTSSDHRIRHTNLDNNRRLVSDKKSFTTGKDKIRASRTRVTSSDTNVMSSMQSNPKSSWELDPEEQWKWLRGEMEEARRKDQNVRKYYIINIFITGFLLNNATVEKVLNTFFT